MRPFCFTGRVPLSKSILNRVQIINSFLPTDNSAVNSILNTCFDETAEPVAGDVLDLRTALRNMQHGETNIDCGSGGTTFRFMALRVSRNSGNWVLRGSNRLMHRPHHDVLDIFKQLQVTSCLVNNELLLTTSKWHWNDPIVVSGVTSSQFISGILLSAWELPQDLVIQCRKPIVSLGYLHMTLAVLRVAGMHVTVKDDETSGDIEIRIPAQQTVNFKNFSIEQDVSSAFGLAAIAALAGSAYFTGISRKSLQPDIFGFEILQNMGARVEFFDDAIRVTRENDMGGIDVDLSPCPDLLPVLSVVCAKAQAKSTIRGIAHVRGKESDRVAKVCELLSHLGVRTHVYEHHLEIFGLKNWVNQNPITFDPDHDHRMAMAAQVAQWAGASINILHKEVVAKSFPNFWHLTDLTSNE